MPEPRARRLRERLARSGRLFVAGLIVACGAQVLIEWHTTVREVNGLRGQLRQKGENYVDVLRKASEDAMAEGNGVELDRIAGRLFDDEDVVYVRFQAADGRSVHERLRPSFGERVRRRFRQPFREHYRYVMERDLAQMIGDPVGLRERMEHSRHGDWIQRLTDAEDRLLERLGRAPPESGAKPEILYQDRLAMHHGAADRSLSYALGTIERPDRRGRPLGVVLLAFSDARVERAVASRLVRGAVTTLLFVGLVAAQHLGARRRRLRLLDLEREVAGAREWL